MKDAFKSIFDKVEAKAAKDITKENGDYLNDEGLLMCGKCHTPKQCVVKFFGEIRKPHCLCKCGKQKELEYEAEFELRELKRKIELLRKKCFRNKTPMAWTFENDDKANPKVTELAKRYVENFQMVLRNSASLMFYGDTGSGKSYMAACIANALLAKAYSCLFTSFSRIVNSTSRSLNDRQEYIDNLDYFNLVVIDGFEIEDLTSYALDAALSILESRCEARKPFIVTTCSPPPDKFPKGTSAGYNKKYKIYSILAKKCIKVKFSARNNEKEQEFINEFGRFLGVDDL